MIACLGWGGKNVRCASEMWRETVSAWVCRRGTKKIVDCKGAVKGKSREKENDLSWSLWSRDEVKEGVE